MRTSRNPKSGLAIKHSVIKEIKTEELKKPVVVKIEQSEVKHETNKRRRSKTSTQDNQLLGGN